MKTLYKINIFLLKVLPVVMAFSYLLNTQLSLLGTAFQMIVHYVGLVITPLAFMYISSYVFQFCNYHRMFLHYITFEELLNTIDWYYQLPLTDKQLDMLHLITALIFLITAVIMYIKKRKTIKCITRDE